MGHSYLNIGDAYGRLLLSIYFGAQLGYRVLLALIPQCQQIKSQISMLISFTILPIFTLIFLFFDNNIIWLYFLWGMTGFFASSIYPEIRIWTEQITPLTGIISTIYSVTNSMGGMIGLYGGGVLISQYSVSEIKYIIFGFTFNGLLFFIINSSIYWFYLKHKKYLMGTTNELAHVLMA